MVISNISSHPLFYGLVIENSDILLSQLTHVQFDLCKNKDLLDELMNAVDLLELEIPASPKTTPSLALVKDQIDNLPLAALLAQPRPYNVAGVKNHNMLNSLVVAVSLFLRSWKKGEYESPIQDACLAVRMLATIDKKHISKLPDLAPDIEVAFEQIWQKIYETDNEISPIHKRLYPIQNLFGKYIKEQDERRKNHAEHILAAVEMPHTGFEENVVEYREYDRAAPEGSGVPLSDHNADLSVETVLLDHGQNSLKSSARKSSRVDDTDIAAFHKNSISYQKEYLEDKPADKFSEFAKVLFSDLSLLTGRKVERLEDLSLSPGYQNVSEYWKAENGVISLAFRPKIGMREINNDNLANNEIPIEDIVNYTETEHLVLPLPPVVSSGLLAYFQAINNGETVDWATPLPRKIFTDIETSISQAQLYSYLSKQMSNDNVDSVVAGLILGYYPGQAQGMTYTQIKAMAVIKIYQKALAQFGCETPLVKTNAVVGSALVPKASFITKNMAAQAKKLKKMKRKNIGEMIFYHNRYTEYVYQVLTLATAHRPVEAPFASILDFDFRRSIVGVSDKERQLLSSPRHLPLGSTAKRQVEAYIKYLKSFRNTVQFAHPDIADMIEGALNDQQPFLFKILSGETITGVGLDPTHLKHYRQSTPPQLATFLPALPSDAQGAW